MTEDEAEETTMMLRGERRGRIRSSSAIDRHMKREQEDTEDVLEPKLNPEIDLSISTVSQSPRLDVPPSERGSVQRHRDLKLLPRLDSADRDRADVRERGRSSDEAKNGRGRQGAGTVPAIRLEVSLSRKGRIKSEEANLSRQDLKK